jgi:hypothetical protein
MNASDNDFFNKTAFTWSYITIITLDNFCKIYSTVKFCAENLS